MKNVITLVVGDWSHDGHEKTDKYVIKTNLTKDEVQKAFKKAVKLTGFDFTCFDDYGENRISKKDVILLGQHGIDKDDCFEGGDFDLDDEFSLYPELYVNLWLKFTKLGNPNFEWSMVEGEDVQIGGYGLYG
jgi:hypothetical protein